jgi:hypothetical protein
MIVLKLTSPGDAVFYSSTFAAFTVTPVGGTKTVRGATAPTLSLTGSLPAGLTFSDKGNSTATIEGSTTATGDFPVEITASVPGAAPFSQPLTILVSSQAAIFSSSTVNFTLGVRSSVSVPDRDPTIARWVGRVAQVAICHPAGRDLLAGAKRQTAGDSRQPHNATVTITGLLPGESPPSFQVDIQP